MCCGRLAPQGGHCQQAAGGRLEQGLPVPTDWPQAQTRLDAIALPRRSTVLVSLLLVAVAQTARVPTMVLS